MSKRFYAKIDTKMASGLTDQQLLAQVDLVFQNDLPTGWGWLAELCKRYEELTDGQKDSSV